MFPSWPQWRQLTKFLSNNEKKLLFVFLLFFFISSAYLSLDFYIKKTILKPNNGGHYIEGAIGQPQLINPILSINQLDKDITSLVFSSLFKYNEKGELLADLAEKYQIENNGKDYIITIKNNVFWHNNEKFKIEDILFTIEAIKNPDYQSNLRPILSNVTFEKKDDHTIIFHLNESNYLFLSNLTFGILPQFLENIDPKKFHLSEFNLRPIGTGPYQLDNFIKNKSGAIESLTLKKFKNYYQEKPYLDLITFKFFSDEEEIKKALIKNKIHGISFIPPKRKQDFKLNNLNIYKISTPSYVGIFFNQSQNNFLRNKSIRLALQKSINKDEIINKVLNGEGEKIDIAILNFLLNKAEFNDFNINESKKILTEIGFEIKDGVMTKTVRLKDGKIKEEKLEFNLTVLNNQELIEAAEIIKNQWTKINVSINIESLPLNDLISRIKTRDYQAILFAEILNLLPDPSPFWHSSAKKHPGLNLSLYDNQAVDTLLKEIKITKDLGDRKQKYLSLTDLISKDIPAIFLYSPKYLFGVNEKIKGIKVNLANFPQDRFNNITDWYIKTKRIWAIQP